MTIGEMPNMVVNNVLDNDLPYWLRLVLSRCGRRPFLLRKRTEKRDENKKKRHREKPFEWAGKGAFWEETHGRICRAQNYSLIPQKKMFKPLFGPSGQFAKG
jgi:hypothetical protein